MKKYGLLGRKLLHSLSPEIHRELGNARYDLFQLEPNELDEFFEKKDFVGINVTFPYKKMLSNTATLSPNRRRRSEALTP